jgi:serine/threonine protein kinase
VAEGGGRHVAVAGALHEQNLLALARVGHGEYADCYHCVGLENPHERRIVKVARPAHNALTFSQYEFGVARREAELLWSLRGSDHIVHMYSSLQHPLALELEVMEHGDLGRFMLRNFPEGLAFGAIPSDLFVSFSQQILRGLHTLHERNIMHRDIKPGNILVGNQGLLKLADFGLARTMKPMARRRSRAGTEREYTVEVVTWWYRPLELLLGGHRYNEKIDCWSCALVLLELLAGHPPLAPPIERQCEVDLILNIFRTFGTPTPANGPNLLGLPFFCEGSAKWPNFPPRFPGWIPRGARTLLQGLLEYNPRDRSSAKDAMDDPMFDEVRGLSQCELLALNSTPLNARRVPIYF